AGVKTLVESSIAPELGTGGKLPSVPLNAHDVAVLRRFLHDGGRLVVLDDDFGGEGDAEIGLPGSHKVEHRAGAIALAGANEIPGVVSIAGSIPALFPLAIPKATPLLASDGATVALAYPFGKGEVVAISAPALFGNSNLAKADNARFAYDLLAGRGRIAFDERPHGYAVDKSLWDALPQPTRWAFWIVCAVVGLALIGANVRFAPPIPLDPPDERDSSAYVRAMASLLRRAHSARAAIGTFYEDGQRRARRHPDLPPESASAIDELARLHNISRPGDAVLIRAATIDARLRKDLT
ncbi:MAG: hypothetical protein M3R30_09380, partial [Candidatus Eremiobacteraeota bacterium]|nr:hypothetical protein [Candidatus Eremiobacteraeota bacterium]